MTYRGELLERCAGYYDGVHGVLFVDAATKEHHFAIDIHEGTHRWLANHSVLGYLYRFFSLVEETADEDFPPHALAEVRSVRELIAQTTYLPQELTATYISLHACRKSCLDAFEAVVDSLPPSYYDLYELGLCSFGSLDSDENDEESGLHAEIVGYIAMASMSPPISAVPPEIDLNDLSNFRDFLATHSGNERYRQILEHAVAPYGEPGMITDAVRLGIEGAQEFVEAIIEAACPGVRVQRERDGMPEWAASFFLKLRIAVAAIGSSALSDVGLNYFATEEDGPGYRQELSLSRDGQPVPFFDTAFTHLGHQPVDDGVVDYLIDLATSADVSIHAHLTPVVPGTYLADPSLPDGGCLLFVQVLIPDEEPMLYAAPLSHGRVHQLLDDMPPGALVVRARADLYPELKPVIEDHLHGRRIYLCVLENAADQLRAFVAEQPRSFIFFATVGHPQVPDMLIQVVMDGPEVLIAGTTEARWAALSGQIAGAGRHVILGPDDPPETSGIDLEEMREVVNVLCLGLIHAQA